MMRKTSLAAIGAVALLALSPVSAWAAGDGSVVPSNKAGSPAAAAATTKAQKCAETKKKIADYESAAAAAPKGAKVSGAESIKSDISWYKSNCS